MKKGLLDLLDWHTLTDKARVELIYSVADKFLIEDIKVGFIINEVISLFNKENKIKTIAPLHIEEINENLI